MRKPAFSVSYLRDYLTGVVVVMIFAHLQIDH